MQSLINFLKTNRKSRKSAQQSSVQLQVENLEGRWVPASIGTKLAGLDFGGDYISGAHMQQGGWANSAKSFASFHSLFNSSRSWLDLSGNGVVNNTDANMAITYVMNKVRADYAPFKVSIFQQDQDTFQSRLTNSFKGDVSVMITGSTAAAHTAGKSWWGVAPSVDTGNTKDEIVFVFAGGSVDSSVFIGGNRAHNWLNQVARTVSHEMGHAFGLDHVENAKADPITHEAMGTWNRDWKRDFVLQDSWYKTGSNKWQNSHQHLKKSNILGDSNNKWIQVLKPGELTISGNSASNKIYIKETATTFIVTMDGKTTVVNKSGSNVNSLNPFDQKLSRVKVLGEGGNDYIYAYSTVVSSVRAYGGSGNDTIVGGQGNDYLFGETGHDRIYGRNGNDYMSGSWGNDYLSGSNGHDRMYGNSGNDTLIGSNGVDRMYGHSGNDYLSGGNDRDYMYGHDGDDRMYGHGGNDYMRGGNGNDTMLGYDGADYMRGEGGHDRIYGHNGNDSIYGDAGNDYLYGHNDNDYIRGGSGTDRLYGYSGNDRLYGDTGKDYLFGHAGNDYLDGGKDGSADYLNGGSGADKFRQELYWWFGWKNRDKPVDFNAGEGDTLV